MFNTEIGTFCNLHENWRELLAADPYNLKIKEDKEYVLFSYDQIRSDFSNPIVREARGIIFRKDYWQKPACWPFSKFFNYGESNAVQIDWSTAFVTEKIDGSLIKLWWNCLGGWHISTNGTIDAFEAPLSGIGYADFGTYFCSTLINQYDIAFSDLVEDLDINCTYMFELAGPQNRVVVPYEESVIYFLGARNNYSGIEQDCLSSAVPRYIHRPRVYPLMSLKDCIKLAEEYSWDQEGFVVSDANFNRVKIKSPAYVRAHYMRSTYAVTRKRLVEVILANEEEEFLCYAKDYTDQIKHCKSLVNTYYTLGEMFAAAGRRASRLSRAEYAEMVKCFPRIFQGLMFVNYERECSVRDYTADWTSAKWEKYLTSMEELTNEYFNKE